MPKDDAKIDAIVGDLDAKYWVQKSDPLVLMRSVPFSLGELKILDTYISRINAADDSRRTVIFSKKEYEDLMGLKSANYRALQSHTKNMLGKVVELEMPNKEYLQFVLFEQARYRKDEYGKPVIELTCTTMAKDLFFCIDKYHYIKYALENIINLTRKASYLLYLYINLNLFRKEWTVSLDKLRDTILDCKGQESYLEYKIFRNRVLNPAVKEINEKTDCTIEYEPIKRSRKVVEIRFIYKNEKELEVQEPAEVPLLTIAADAEEDEEEKWLEKYGSDRLALLAEGCSYEFDKVQMEQIARVLVRIRIPKDEATNSIAFGRQFYLREKYAALNTEAARKASKGETPIKNRFKYFLKMLEEDAFQPIAYKEES